MILEVDNLSTGYGKKQILFNFSLRIFSNEIVLIVGNNGSGKSTLLKAICNTLPSFENFGGKIFFGNEEITYQSTFQIIQKGLMYVPQKYNCFDNLSVKENLEVSYLIHSDRKSRKRSFTKSLERFPLLRNYLEKRPFQLSGGERQLLAIAMAITSQSKLVLLDEPFAGLSVENIELVKRQLLRWHKEENIGFLIVEHRIKELSTFADKIIGIKMGANCDLENCFE